MRRILVAAVLVGATLNAAWAEGAAEFCNQRSTSAEWAQGQLLKGVPLNDAYDVAWDRAKTLAKQDLQEALRVYEQMFYPTYMTYKIDKSGFSPEQVKAAYLRACLELLGFPVSK
jgi:hypothetical protein